MKAKEMRELQAEQAKEIEIQNIAQEIVKAIFRVFVGNGVPTHNYFSFEYKTRYLSPGWVAFQKGEEVKALPAPSAVKVSEDNLWKVIEAIQSILEKDGYRVRVDDVGWRKYNGWFTLGVNW